MIIDRFAGDRQPFWVYGRDNTIKHVSWLDLAESELGVLTSQCLDRRITDKQTLIEEIGAWSAIEMLNTPRQVGNSQRPTPGSHSGASTLQI
jgi:hypothetical protein